MTKTRNYKYLYRSNNILLLQTCSGQSCRSVADRRVEGALLLTASPPLATTSYLWPYWKILYPCGYPPHHILKPWWAHSVIFLLLRIVLTFRSLCGLLIWCQISVWIPFWLRISIIHSLVYSQERRPSHFKIRFAASFFYVNNIE